MVTGWSQPLKCAFIEWPSHWDQGAVSTVVGGIGAVSGLVAVFISFRTRRRVRRELSLARLQGALVTLIRAATDVSVATRMRGAARACGEWRSVASEAIGLLTDLPHAPTQAGQLRTALIESTTMARISEEALHTAVSLNAAIGETRIVIAEAADLATQLRVIMEQGGMR